MQLYLPLNRQLCQGFALEIILVVDRVEDSGQKGARLLSVDLLDLAIETLAESWWDEGAWRLLGFSAEVRIEIRWAVLFDVLCLVVFHFG